MIGKAKDLYRRGVSVFSSDRKMPVEMVENGDKDARLNIQMMLATIVMHSDKQQIQFSPTYKSGKPKCRPWSITPSDL